MTQFILLNGYLRDGASDTRSLYFNASKIFNPAATGTMCKFDYQETDKKTTKWTVNNPLATIVAAIANYNGGINVSLNILKKNGAEYIRTEVFSCDRVIYSQSLTATQSKLTYQEFNGNISNFTINSTIATLANTINNISERVDSLEVGGGEGTGSAEFDTFTATTLAATTATITTGTITTATITTATVTTGNITTANITTANTVIENITPTAAAKAIYVSALLHTGTKIADFTASIADASVNIIDMTVTMSTAFTTGKTVKGSNISITSSATDVDASGYIANDVALVSTALSKADLTSYKSVISGTLSGNAGTQTVIGVHVAPTATLNSATTTFYGIKVDTSGMTNTSAANSYGLFIDSSATTANLAYGIYAQSITGVLTVNDTASNDVVKITPSAAKSGISIYCDSTSAANAINGIYISKDITNATAAGSLALSEEALFIQSNNATSAAASGATTWGTYLTTVQMTNTTSVASADTYTGVLCGLSYSASTTGSGTATNRATCLEVDYNVDGTAGTMTLNGLDVQKITYDTVGAPAYVAGSYNLLSIKGADQDTPTVAASTILSGLSVDLSLIKVTDADLTLYGAYFNLPTSGTSTYATIASYETFKMVTTQDTKTITLNSRNYATATTGDIIGFQSKPAATNTAATTLAVYGCQISPRLNDDVDASTLIGIQSEPLLKGATAATVSGDVICFDARLSNYAAENGHTVGGVFSGMTFSNTLKTGTYTGGVFCMDVKNHGDTQVWTGLLHITGALGTNSVTTASDKDANAASGTLKVYVDSTLYHIQLYAD